MSLRFTRRWGPHRIAYHLGLARSTVGRVLARYGMPKLVNIDQATGLPVRKPTPKRYEVARPGQLIHVDIKKQGRIPDGGGWRAFGRGSAQDRAAGSVRDKAARAGAAGSRGYRYLHHAVDDNSRVAYSEILDDERKETAAGFWTRANAFFASLGVTVTAVMTDNGACYRSHAFADALGDGVKHKWTKPYRPQTNGKVERFNRTLAAEWAYAKPYASEAERAAAYETWLHHYNHHRPHTGPLKIEQRTGSMDAAAIAAYDPDALASVFKETPAVHRFPGSMAARVQSLCQALVDDWGGDAAALWTEGDPDGATVLKRLKALPGFGEQKAKIFLALLGKQDDTGERGCLRGEGIGDEIDRDAVEQRGLERPAEASRGVEHGDLCADLRPLEGRDEPRHAPADHDDASAVRTQQRVGSPRGFGRIGHASILAGLRGRQRPRVVACG